MTGRGGPFALPEDPAARRIWRVDRATGLPVPRYDGRSLPNVGRTVADAGGARGSRRAPALAEPLADDLDPFDRRPSAGTTIVLLVDGLGWSGFRAWAGAPTEAGRAWSRRADPITTVFPSTTTAALVSLSTATPPGRHGLIGYRQYLPRFGVVGDMLSMSPTGATSRDLLIGPEWTPPMVTGAPTVFRRGLRAVALSRDIFEGTGFTRLLYDGAEFVGYSTAVHLVHQLASVLRRPRPPGAVFLYWADLDTIRHLVGPDARWTAIEMDRIVDLFRRTVEILPRGLAETVTVLVTGDHGQVPADLGQRVAVDEEPSLLREMVRPLAGDRRAGFFAARAGRRAALTRALRARLLPGSPVLPREAVVRAGLFGRPPFHPEIDERIGDVIAFVRSPQCLTYRIPGAAAPKRFLAGAHGGVEAEELVVPLVRGTFAELAASPTARPPRQS